MSEAASTWSARTSRRELDLARRCGAPGGGPAAPGGVFQRMRGVADRRSCSGARSWRQRERRGTEHPTLPGSVGPLFRSASQARATTALAHRTGCERDGYRERSTAGGEEVLAQGTRRCMHGPPLRVARAQRPPCCVSSPRRTTRMASLRSRSSRPTVRRHGQSAAFPCPSSAAVPAQSAHGGSGWLGAPRGEAGPLGAQPPPRMLERAASNAADFPAGHRRTAHSTRRASSRHSLLCVRGAGSQNIMKWDCIIPGKAAVRS